MSRNAMPGTPLADCLYYILASELTEVDSVLSKESAICPEIDATTDDVQTGELGPVRLA